MTAVILNNVGLCSSRAWWPLAPNFCSWAIRKSYFLHTNHICWAPQILVLSPLQFSLEHSLVMYVTCHLIICFFVEPTNHFFLVIGTPLPWGSILPASSLPHCRHDEESIKYSLRQVQYVVLWTSFSQRMAFSSLSDLIASFLTRKPKGIPL